MEVRKHILLGGLFSIPFLYFGLLEAVLIFFASFLIDFDHYLLCVYRTKDYSLKKALRYFDKNRRGLLIFHTIEFILATLMLSYFVSILKWVSIGLFFHILLDYSQIYRSKGKKYRRFSLIYQYYLKHCEVKK